MGVPVTDWHSLLKLLTTDNFLVAYKILSPLGAAAFALLGLVTDFWHEGTKRVTRSGLVAIVGVSLSAAIGMTASVIEHQQDVARDEAQLKQLHEIQRSVNLFAKPVVTIVLHSDRARTIAWLKSYPSHVDGIGNFSVKSDKIPVEYLQLSFFDNKHPYGPGKNSPETWDVNVSMVEGSVDEQAPADGTAYIRLSGPVRPATLGAIRSWIDLPGATVEINCNSDTFCNGNLPGTLMIDDENGGGIGANCDAVTSDPGYWKAVCKIPEDFFEQQEKAEYFSINWDDPASSTASSDVSQ